MQALIKDINSVAEKELARALSVYPKFSSKHEAVGVLLEEVYELNVEYTNYKAALEFLIRGVFKDEPVEEIARETEKLIKLMLAEGTQVLAMIKKLMKYLEEHGNE